MDKDNYVGKKGDEDWVIVWKGIEIARYVEAEDAWRAWNAIVSGEDVFKVRHPKQGNSKVWPPTGGLSWY